MHAYQVTYTGTSLKLATKALILLHGRGSSAADILRLAGDFSDKTFTIAAPQATNSSWYPHSFLAEERSNEPWLSSAIALIARLIEEISAHIPKEKIYLIGFSQGACLALEIACRHPHKYGGIVAFTGGLIGKEIQPEKYKGTFAGTQVFIGTSDHDPHVPLERCKQTMEIMEKLGAQVTLKIYPGMGHTITDDEISTAKKLIFDHY